MVIYFLQDIPRLQTRLFCWRILINIYDRHCLCICIFGQRCSDTGKCSAGRFHQSLRLILIVINCIRISQCCCITWIDSLYQCILIHFILIQIIFVDQLIQLIQLLWHISLCYIFWCIRTAAVPVHDIPSSKSKDRDHRHDHNSGQQSCRKTTFLSACIFFHSWLLSSFYILCTKRTKQTFIRSVLPQFFLWWRICHLLLLVSILQICIWIYCCSI